MLDSGLILINSTPQMVQMIITTSPLKQALTTLNRALARASLEPKDLEVRDACIQRFEYTYELCIKLIKRYIEQEMPISENVDRLNYRDLLRVAFEIGIIQNVDQWFLYREARNNTSHAYDENKALAVFKVIPEFATQAQFLIEQLTIALGNRHDPAT